MLPAKGYSMSVKLACDSGCSIMNWDSSALASETAGQGYCRWLKPLLGVL